MSFREKKVFWVRASSFKELFDCPYRWYGNNILKIRRPTSFKGHIGSSVHKALELHDLAVINQDGFVSSKGALKKIAMDTYANALANPTYEVFNDGEDVDKYTKIGQSLIDTYCETIAPQYTFTHVELKCKTMSVDVGNVILEVTGTIDRIYQNAEGSGIADHKTGVMAVNAQNEVEVVSHKPQLGIYEILAEHTLPNVKINQQAHIIGMQTTGKARVAIGKTNSARDVVLGNGDEKGLLEYAGKILEHEMFVGNPSSMMCSDKYCPMYKTCRFRGADAIEIKAEAEHEIEKKELNNGTSTASEESEGHAEQVSE